MRQNWICNQEAVIQFMSEESPDEVILAAAKVGGIYANNTYPAEFIYQNLQIQNNVIHAAHLNNVQLLFLARLVFTPEIQSSLSEKQPDRSTRAHQ